MKKIFLKTSLAALILGVLLLNVNVVTNSNTASHFKLSALDQVFANAGDDSSSSSIYDSSGNSVGDSGIYYTQDQAYEDYNIDNSPDDSGTSDSPTNNSLELVNVQCIKIGVNLSFPISKTTFSFSVGHRNKCKKKDNSYCDLTKVTSCS